MQLRIRPACVSGSPLWADGCSNSHFCSLAVLMYGSGIRFYMHTVGMAGSNKNRTEGASMERYSIFLWMEELHPRRT